MVKTLLEFIRLFSWLDAAPLIDDFAPNRHFLSFDDLATAQAAHQILQDCGLYTSPITAVLTSFPFAYRQSFAIVRDDLPQAIYELSQNGIKFYSD